MYLGEFALAVVVGYVLSILFFLSRRASRWVRTIELFILFPAVLACPLLIDTSAPVLRCLAGVTLFFFLTKCWDVYLRADFYTRVSLRTWLVFLMNHCFNVPRHCQDFVTVMPFHRRLREFKLRLGGLFIFSFAVWLTLKQDWSQWGFWGEHFVKAIFGLLWIKSAFETYGAIWQLAGARIIPFAPHLFSADTPARFWRRWHRSGYPWYLHDIAEPLRRIGPAFIPVMVAFIVSGLVHEYAFAGLPLRHFSGYMLAFFIVQGIAVIAAHRLTLVGPWRILGVVLTWGFVLFSAVWFVAPVNQFVPIYDNPIPSWILLW
jgi:hypothetical protein